MDIRHEGMMVWCWWRWKDSELHQGQAPGGQATSGRVQNSSGDLATEHIWIPRKVVRRKVDISLLGKEVSDRESVLSGIRMEGNCLIIENQTRKEQSYCNKLQGLTKYLKWVQDIAPVLGQNWSLNLGWTEVKWKQKQEPPSINLPSDDCLLYPTFSDLILVQGNRSYSTWTHARAILGTHLYMTGT